MEYPVRTRQWTRAEYDRLIEIGVFQPGDAAELLGGEIIVAEPQNSPHYTAIGSPLGKRLRRGEGALCLLRSFARLFASYLDGMAQQYSGLKGC